MDSTLLAKFPCGAIWWKVQHPAAESWQQAFYEPQEVTNPTTNTNDYLHTNEASRSRHEPSAMSRKYSLKPVCEYLLDMIDPYASLYTKMQKIDAMQWFKQRLFNFVSSDAHMYLGPKKSRVLSMWLSGNSCKPDSETIVREFVNLLMGDRVPEVMVLHLDRRGNWFVKEEQ